MGQTTGVSATTTPQGNDGTKTSASVTSPSHAASAAPTGTGQKSNAVSAHQVLAFGPHVLVGCVVGMIMAI